MQRVLSDYPKVFQAPESLEFDYGSLSAGFSVERFPDECFTGVYAYSQLMLEKDFYKRLLIHQLDAFVFSDELLEFCKMGYDYIRAPVLSLACIGNGGIK